MEKFELKKKDIVYDNETIAYSNVEYLYNNLFWIIIKTRHGIDTVETIYCKTGPKAIVTTNNGEIVDISLTYSNNESVVALENVEQYRKSTNALLELIDILKDHYGEIKKREIVK